MNAGSILEKLLTYTAVLLGVGFYYGYLTLTWMLFLGFGYTASLLLLFSYEQILAAGLESLHKDLVTALPTLFIVTLLHTRLRERWAQLLSAVLAVVVVAVVTFYWASGQHVMRYMVLALRKQGPASSLFLFGSTAFLSLRIWSGRLTGLHSPGYRVGALLALWLSTVPLLAYVSADTPRGNEVTVTYRDGRTEEGLYFFGQQEGLVVLAHMKLREIRLQKSEDIAKMVPSNQAWEVGRRRFWRLPTKN